MLHHNDVSRLAVAAFDTYDLSSFNVNKTVALASIAHNITEEFRELNRSKVKQTRCQRFKTGSADDYAEMFINLGGGKHIICGIRHQGCNPKLPFINCWPDFEIKSQAEAFTIAELNCIESICDLMKY